MKIRVTLTIDVDPQKWADGPGGTVVWENGDYRLSSIREDVRVYIRDLVKHSSVAEETEATVELA